MRPDPVTGAIPGMLRRGTPVARSDGSAPGVVSSVVDDDCCYIADTPPDHFTRSHDGYTNRSRFVDTSDPTALVHIAMWLASKAHPSAWMLPRALGLGGTVEDYAGHTAHEIAACLLTWSVTGVLGGRTPIFFMLGHWADTGTGHIRRNLGGNSVADAKFRRCNMVAAYSDPNGWIVTDSEYTATTRNRGGGTWGAFPGSDPCGPETAERGRAKADAAVVGSYGILWDGNELRRPE